MAGHASSLYGVQEFIHRRFLWLLVAAYALAAVWPAPGSALRQVSVSRLQMLDQEVIISLPMLLLAGLLLNAGLGVDASELRKIVRRPHVVLAGMMANVLVPIVFVLLLFQGLRFWHDPDEAQSLLVGLAVVAAMPIAGSSTAWSQNANGSLALSLGLVVLSTILSPVTTPATLAAIKVVTTGDYASALARLSGQKTGAFLLVCVVVPSLAGMFLRRFLGEERTSQPKPALKLVNAVLILVLCYANASVSLPKIVAEPDWDFLALILIAVVALCVSTFGAGWLLARLLNVGDQQKRSLMFGLGMNNNGTGMVLACASLASLPWATLPVLAYNLVQHLAAGGVHWSFERKNRGQRP